MKHLICFSLKRRFINHTTIVLNIMVFLVIGCAFFADKIITVIYPDFSQPIMVYIDESLQEDMNALNDLGEEKYIFVEGLKKDLVEKEYNLFLVENNWIVESQYSINKAELNQLSSFVLAIQKARWMNSTELEEAERIERLFFPILENKPLYLSKTNADQQNLIFIIITGIYFMMLSFSSVAANEVVYEKTSKILELILTSISAKTHFLSKMITGWLTMIVQVSLALLYGLICFFMRMQFDGGLGLLRLFKWLGLFEGAENNFIEMTHSFQMDVSIVMNVIFGIVFVVLGIVLIQMILVVFSSYINSIEESSNVQGPCYLVLLFIYYFVLTINNPHQLSEGIGFYLSFLPFFNMLLMPCRMMLDITIWELLLSLVLTLITIAIVVEVGSRYYEQGLLEGKS